MLRQTSPPPLEGEWGAGLAWLMWAVIILPPFAQASRWPSERIVRNRSCVSLRPTERASRLCRASARLGACFRIGELHLYGRQDDYFSIQIVHSDTRKRLLLQSRARFQPDKCRARIGHCTFTAEREQHNKRGKHCVSRQRAIIHRGWHRQGR